MLGSSVINQKISTTMAYANNSSYSQPMPYPDMADQQDYEVQLHVNFQTQEMRLLKVIGASDEADVFLFTRERCRPGCTDANCLSCRTRKLYQDKAGDPQGTVPYTPHQEYLYCLRFDRQPITALLSVIPRERDVEVKEKGVLAYWIMKWLERSKILNPQGAVAGIGQMLMASGSRQTTPRAQEMPLFASAPMPPRPQPPQYEQYQQQKDDNDEDEDCKVMHRADDGPSDNYLPKQTGAYLPNMQVVYQVKKDQMSIMLPKPEQLTRPIDVILVTVDKEGHGKQQKIPLVPGDTHSSTNLIALRNTAYTLQVQLHDRGNPVDLLDFITECKILRVQESKDAPKQLNFLMERLIDQRGTFVLHITFDEKIVDVNAQPIGEFYIDVDVDWHRMMIGTISSHAEKHYRVEKICKPAGGNVLLAEKQLIFEGGVDPNSLTMKDSIPIERMSDYVITVFDPVTKQSLPTSVLAFHKHALFVKEIKNSDVRLHVTVQRQPTMMTQSSNANNLRTSAATSSFPIKRADSNAAFHCPFHSGWSSFRIHHSTSGRWLETPHESTDTTTSLAADTTETVSNMTDACFSLDVDMQLLKARLVATEPRTSNNSLLIIYEDCPEGKTRSTPCQMSQVFKINHWCKYTVKCVADSSLTPLLTFCVTNKEVTDVKSCNSCVRLNKRDVLML